VDHVSFEVPAGSLATLLGPSGCGKTTTLGCWPAWRSPTPARCTGGRRLTLRGAGDLLSPEKRRMGMVFQSYAIWPHMTVFENIAFRCARSGCRPPRSASG
jgi:iron(III) transport system ATP-binding protein